MAWGVDTLGKGSWADQGKLLNSEMISRSDLTYIFLFALLNYIKNTCLDVCILYQIPVSLRIFSTELSAWHRVSV